MIWRTFPGLDVYHTDPAQPIITAGSDVDYVDGV